MFAECRRLGITKACRIFRCKSGLVELETFSAASPEHDNSPSVGRTGRETNEIDLAVYGSNEQQMRHHPMLPMEQGYILEPSPVGTQGW